MDDIAIDEAVRLRGAVSRLAKRFHATATDEGLTPSQASVLGSISAHAPVGVSDLLALEHLNPTMLSRVVTMLDEAGLVRRLPQPHDLRAVLLEPTAAGRQLHERVKAQRAALVLAAVEHLPAAEQAALRAALPALESLARVMAARDR